MGPLLRVSGAARETSHPSRVAWGASLEWSGRKLDCGLNQQVR
jgi:hypothetical protein